MSYFSKALHEHRLFHVMTWAAALLFVAIDALLGWPLLRDPFGVILPGLVAIWVFLYGLNDSLDDILSTHLAQVGDELGVAEPDSCTADIRALLRVLDPISVGVFVLSVLGAVVALIEMHWTVWSGVSAIVECGVLAWSTHLYYAEHGWQLPTMQYLTRVW